MNSCDATSTCRRARVPLRGFGAAAWSGGLLCWVGVLLLAGCRAARESSLGEGEGEEPVAAAPDAALPRTPEPAPEPAPGPDGASTDAARGAAATLTRDDRATPMPAEELSPGRPATADDVESFLEGLREEGWPGAESPAVAVEEDLVEEDLVEEDPVEEDPVEALLRETAAIVRGEAPERAATGGDEEFARARQLLAEIAADEGAAGAATPAGDVLRSGGAPKEPAENPATPPAPPPGAPAPSGGETAEKPETAKKADAPLPAARPLEPPQEAGAEDKAKEGERPKFQRAGDYSIVKTLHHKNVSELFRYLREIYPEWIDKGHLFRVTDRGRSVVIFTEKPIAEDPLGQQILAVVDDFDLLDVEIERAVVRPRFIALDILMESLVMAGLANIYQLTEETDVLTWKEGNKTRSATRKKNSYIQTGMVEGATAPLGVPHSIPYVYEIGTRDPFEIPREYTGQSERDKTMVVFSKTSSTEERGGMMVVGTNRDIERIRAFVDNLDVPARQIMVEIQVIELDASKLTDFGIDSVQFGGGHSIGTLALPFPGDPLIEPGLPGAPRDANDFIPPIMAEGFDFGFDDTTEDLRGRFLFRLHYLVRQGDAKVKARPKLLTLDDRTSVLHIGQEEPVFSSTAVTRDATNGNLITEVQGISTQYVGFTLNIRPRITGGAEDEVAMQIEIIVSTRLGDKRVFESDIGGIPIVAKRHYIGQNRVKNHRPMILGGLIRESDVENVSKIPLLADIPLLGYLFRRTETVKQRTEVIFVVTPHILSETGVDRVATPKESIHFDTFDSVLFNDRHVIKGGDVIGIDPINKVPARGPEGDVFSEKEVVDLTLLNIVKKRELVSKLDILGSYLEREAEELSWVQRKWPERTVKDWGENEQDTFFRAAAIVIQNIHELNEGLTFYDVVTPRREIIVPTSPYRISLSYDEVQALKVPGLATVFREGRVDLDQNVADLLRQSADRNLNNFADFLEKKKRLAEDHGEVLPELRKLYASLNPRGRALDGIPYPQVYRELDKVNIDFMTMATYFQTHLDDKYQITGAPDIKLFADDFVAFLRASLSLTQRARRLKDLDHKWQRMNELDREEALRPEDDREEE
ncbi:MAG: hypothetical protein O7J95_14280 [Planctomycetota bacterium]|nr:hypothetical protein [Planctomycetota bacterium]